MGKWNFHYCKALLLWGHNILHNKERKLGKIVLETHYSREKCNIVNAIRVYSTFLQTGAHSVNVRGWECAINVLQHKYQDNTEYTHLLYPFVHYSDTCSYQCFQAKRQTLPSFDHNFFWICFFTYDWFNQNAAILFGQAINQYRFRPHVFQINQRSEREKAGFQCSRGGKDNIEDLPSRYCADFIHQAVRSPP